MVVWVFVLVRKEHAGNVGLHLNGVQLVAILSRVPNCPRSVVAR